MDNMRPLTVPLFVVCLMASSSAIAQKGWQAIGDDSVSAGAANYQELEFSPVSQTLYVAYQDEVNGNGTTVRKYDGSQWVTVGTEGFSDGEAEYLSLAFPPASDTPYLAYRDVANGEATTVKKFNGSQWVTVGSDSFSDGATDHQQLAISSSDTLYVAHGYYDEVEVMKYNGNQWVQVGGRFGYLDDNTADDNISLAVSSDTPYVAFGDLNQYGGISVYYFDGTSWGLLGSSNFSDSDADYVNLKFHPLNGTPYVAYKDGSSILEKYVADSSKWIEVDYSYGGDYVNLAFDPSSGQPYIGLSDVNNFDNAGGSTVAKYLTDSSAFEVVGSRAFSDSYSGYQHLAIHPTTGVPYIAFRGEYNVTTVMDFDSVNCATYPDPTASFDYTTHTYSLEVDFSDPPLDVDSVKWFFGHNDSTSTAQYPSYEYPSPDTYTACLVAYDLCTDTVCKEIPVTDASSNTGVSKIADQQLQVQAFPQPANAKIHLRYELPLASDQVKLTIFNEKGQQLRIRAKGHQSKGVHREHFDFVKPGLYFYQLTTEHRVKRGKIIVR